MSILQCLKVDCRRLCHNYHYILMIIIMTIFSLCDVVMGGGIKFDNNVLYYIAGMTIDQKYFLIYLLVFFVYGSSFIDDFKHQYIRQVLQYKRILPYVSSKMIVIFISSMLAIAASLVLSSLVLRIFKPWSGENMDYFYKLNLASVYGSENYILLILLMGLQIGLMAGFLCCSSAFVSIWIENKILCGTMTMLIMLTIQYITGCFVDDSQSFIAYFTPACNYMAWGERWIEKALLISGGGFLVCLILTYISITRRIRNE